MCFGALKVYFGVPKGRVGAPKAFCGALKAFSGSHKIFSACQKRFSGRRKYVLGRKQSFLVVFNLRFRVTKVRFRAPNGIVLWLNSWLIAHLHNCFTEKPRGDKKTNNKKIEGKYLFIEGGLFSTTKAENSRFSLKQVGCSEGGLFRLILLYST